MFVTIIATVAHTLHKNAMIFSFSNEYLQENVVFDASSILPSDSVRNSSVQIRLTPQIYCNKMTLS